MGQRDEQRGVIRDRRCVREDTVGGVESACGVRRDVLRVPRCLAAAFGGGGGMGGSGVGTTPKGNAKSKSEPRPLAHVYPFPSPSFVSRSPPFSASTNLGKAIEVVVLCLLRVKSDGVDEAEMG